MVERVAPSAGVQLARPETPCSHTGNLGAARLHARNTIRYFGHSAGAIPAAAPVPGTSSDIPRPQPRVSGPHDHVWYNARRKERAACEARNECASASTDSCQGGVPEARPQERANCRLRRQPRRPWLLSARRASCFHRAANASSGASTRCVPKAEGNTLVEAGCCSAARSDGLRSC